MAGPAELEVTSARPEELGLVRALIVAGLAERWGRYDPTYNPDLDSFGEHYRDAAILVAKEGERLVGCGVLIRDAPQVGRIVRMSVDAERRRRGVGSATLRALLERARSAGYADVVVETTETWESAVAFYLRRGFTVVRRCGGELHFHRRLSSG